MKKLLVSVSGGETSGFMAQWLWLNKRDEFPVMKFVFANTGQENEETLEFIHEMSWRFWMPIYWVEADVNTNKGEGTKYKEVNFTTASRDGKPFSDVIGKYGIPNTKFPHCTRELKERPIHAFAKEFLGDDYYTAIGIRADEADRINPQAREKRFIYPLISMIPTTKQMVKDFWKSQPFRLNLKDYQGNCKTCWKKSDLKLWKIANENPKAFEFFDFMETHYGKGYTFFRNNRSAKDILAQARELSKQTQIEFDDLVGGDSCEIYSSCSE